MIIAELWDAESNTGGWIDILLERMGRSRSDAQMANALRWRSNGSKRKGGCLWRFSHFCKRSSVCKSLNLMKTQGVRFLWTYRLICKRCAPNDGTGHCGLFSAVCHWMDSNKASQLSQYTSALAVAHGSYWSLRQTQRMQISFCKAIFRHLFGWTFIRSSPSS